MNVARTFWLRQLHLWHWVSAALSLVAMLLFAITGLLLNNPTLLQAPPSTVEQEKPLPPELQRALAGMDSRGDAPVAPVIAEWLALQWPVQVSSSRTETSDSEVYITLVRPGLDGGITLDRLDNVAIYRQTDMGWVAFLSDLHKGRNTGVAWSWFIDIFAVACVIFALSGLGLLFLHGRGRQMTWPVASLGLLIPVVLVLLFMH